MFLNLTRFRAEGRKFADLTPTEPKSQDGAMAHYLTDHYGWSWTKPVGAGCHLMHNPTYTSCARTGNLWFDSPIFEEAGCYSLLDLESSRDWKHLDLQHVREKAFCVRYKEEAYNWKLTQTPLGPLAPHWE